MQPGWRKRTPRPIHSSSSRAWFDATIASACTCDPLIPRRRRAGHALGAHRAAQGYDRQPALSSTPITIEPARAANSRPIRNACLLFLMEELERQVRIEGPVESIRTRIRHTSPLRTARRPLRGWASPKARRWPAAHAEARFADAQRRYGEAVPRPPHWGGTGRSPCHRVLAGPRERLPALSTCATATLAGRSNGSHPRHSRLTGVAQGRSIASFSQRSIALDQVPWPRLRFAYPMNRIGFFFHRLGPVNHAHIRRTASAVGTDRGRNPPPSRSTRTFPNSRRWKWATIIDSIRPAAEKEAQAHHPRGQSPPPARRATSSQRATLKLVSRHYCQGTPRQHARRPCPPGSARRQDQGPAYAGCMILRETQSSRRFPGIGGFH